MKKFASVLLITIVLSLTVLADPPPPPPGGVPIGGRVAPTTQTQTSAFVDATSIVKSFWYFVRTIL